MDEYLPMFLAEGREHLQELNLAVVSIEESPDDPATVDEIFRIAHSLKGMSATMGFSGMAALTHEMEDVFELLRQRSGGLERVAIDVLFQCLDALSAAVESIDNTGAEEIQPQVLIESLRGLVRERTPEQEAERLGVAAPDSDELSELADGRRVIQISARLDDDVSMPAVRAYMVLSVIAGYGETLEVHPHARGRRHLRRPRHRRVGRLRAHRHRDPGRGRVRPGGRRGPRLRGRRRRRRWTRPDEVEEEVTAPPVDIAVVEPEVPAGEAPVAARSRLRPRPSRRPRSRPRSSRTRSTAAPRRSASTPSGSTS